MHYRVNNNQRWCGRSRYTAQGIGRFVYDRPPTMLIGWPLTSIAVVHHATLKLYIHFGRAGGVGVDITCQRKPFDCINGIIHCDKSKGQRQNLKIIGSGRNPRRNRQSCATDELQPVFLRLHEFTRQDVTTSSGESWPILTLLWHSRA